MLEMARFFIISNAIASVVVYGLEITTEFLDLKYWSDYAFFVVMLIWGLAALLFIYSPDSGHDGDNVDRVTSAMIDSSAANEIDDQRLSDNTILCIKLLFSGLPAFLVCLIST